MISFYIRGAPEVGSYDQFLQKIFADIISHMKEAGQTYVTKKIRQCKKLAGKCRHRRLIDRFMDDVDFFQENIEREQYQFNQGCFFFLYSKRNFQRITDVVAGPYATLFLDWMELYNLVSRSNYYIVAVKEMGWMKDEFVIPIRDKNTYIYSIIPSKESKDRQRCEEILKGIKEEIKDKAAAFCQKVEAVRSQLEGVTSDGRKLRLL